MGRVRCDHDGGAPGPDGELVAETTAHHRPGAAPARRGPRRSRRTPTAAPGRRVGADHRTPGSAARTRCRRSATVRRVAEFIGGDPDLVGGHLRCSPMVRSGRRTGRRGRSPPGTLRCGGIDCAVGCRDLTSPSTGSISPAIVDISVDFPAPFGPVTTISPSYLQTEMADSTVVPVAAVDVENRVEQRGVREADMEHTLPKARRRRLGSAHTTGTKRVTLLSWRKHPSSPDSSPPPCRW